MDFAKYHPRQQCVYALRRWSLTNVTTEPMAFLWLEFGDQYPFGVEYGKYWTNYNWISYVYVNKECRRQGIARKLYDLAHWESRKLNGVTKLALDVFESNASSVNFHRTLGFQIHATIYRYKLFSEGDK